MLKNYVKIALRNLLKHKAFTLINVFGMSVGLTVAFMIFIYAYHEASSDRFHENADCIYKVHTEIRRGPDSIFFAETSAPMTPAICDEIPEILNYCRFTSAIYAPLRNEQKILLSYGENRFYEEHILFADATVFEIFTYPLIQGNPRTALVNPYSIVLTEQMAEKYFGDENPVGKIIVYDNQFKKFDFTITGVLKNIPDNSHIKFDFLASMSCAEEVIGISPSPWDRWRRSNTFKSFVLMDKKHSPSTLENKLIEFANKHPSPDYPKEITRLPAFQPLTKTHLYIMGRNGLETNENYRQIIMLSVIALLILVIACINYMNLSTSRFENRAHEIGVRKVIGAQRKSLIIQFLGESLFTAIFAFIAALLLTELILPFFSQLVDRNLTLHYFQNWPLILGFLIITLFLGLIAGWYPAVFLSGFHPVSVFQKAFSNRHTKFTFKKVLVVSQFVICIALICTTLIFANQLKYMHKKQLGVFKNQILVIPLRGNWGKQKHLSYKKQLEQHNGILNVSASSDFPSGMTGKRSMRFWWEGNKYSDAPVMLEQHDNKTSFPTIRVDYDFIKTYNFEIIKGRDFSQDYGTDATHAYIVNETAVKTIGWEEPINKIFHSAWSQNKPGRVIGVVKDFNFAPVYKKIQPLVFYIGWGKYLSVKINPIQVSECLHYMAKKWPEHFPDRPFEFFFLDEHFEKIYKSELKTILLLNLSSSLAIIIACLGLYGLIAFTTEKRTKEIGIRKIFGASIPNIINFLIKELLVLILIANLIAWPLAWYAMNKWLQNFAYRIDLTIWPFLLAGVSALVIALLTISFQTVRAATANPVESLRYE